MATTITEVGALPARDLCKHVMGIASGFQLSGCLYVAAKLNIADRVVAGPRPVETLAADTNTQADALYRVLRALISVGIFSEPQSRTIGCRLQLNCYAATFQEASAGWCCGLHTRS